VASDIGSQIVTIRFHRPVDSDVVNKRFRDIRMLGIYKGGRMSWNAGMVTLSPLVCEISDGTHQIRVETTVNVTQALASGQYLVLRWTYTGVVDTDFMEIISANSIDTNDVVVGRVVGTNVVYTERTTPDTHHLFLRIEAEDIPNQNVRIRAGVGHKGSEHSPVADNHLDLSSYAGKTVYVYVSDTGGVTASDEAVDYVGKALLAKVVVPASPGVITNDAIEDVRSFITPPAIPDGLTIERGVNGNLQVRAIFGVWNDRNNDGVADSVAINTVYLAATDGLVTAQAAGSSSNLNIIGYTDGNNPPTTDRGATSVDYTGTQHLTLFVRKGDYWKVSVSGSYTGPKIQWLPIGN